MIALLLAVMLETPTQWEYRTTPTKISLAEIMSTLKCPNGRKIKGKVKDGIWFFCPGPK
jgi:hypothetical protein